MHTRKYRALVLTASLLAVGCSGGGGPSGAIPRSGGNAAIPSAPVTSAPNAAVLGKTAAARAMDALMPAASLPSSIRVPDMVRTTIQPPSAMTALTPQSGERTQSIDPATLNHFSGAAVQIAGANVPSAVGGAGTGIQIWVRSSQPSGSNKSLWAYSDSDGWENLPGAGSAIAVDPNDDELFAVNATSGGLYEYTGFTQQANDGTWSTLGGGAKDVTVGSDGTVYVVSNASTSGDSAIFEYAGGTFTQIHGAGVHIVAPHDQIDYAVPGVGTLTHGGFYIVNAEGNVFYYSPGSGYLQLPGTVSDIAPIVGGYFEVDSKSGADAPIYYEDFATNTQTAEPGQATSISAVSPELYLCNAETAIYYGTFTEPNGLVVSTLAGGSFGTADGVGPTAQFDDPRSVAIDKSGNLFVTDPPNLREVSPAGNVTTIPLPNGYKTSGGIAVDQYDNIFFTDETGTNPISRIDFFNPGSGAEGIVAGGSASGNADGVGAAAEFSLLYDGLAIDSSGNLYVADEGNHDIRKIASPLAGSGGTVSTIAGSPGTVEPEDGQGEAAGFASPFGIAADSSGNLYVVDSVADATAFIRKISPSGAVTTIAGNQVGYADGIGSSAGLTLDGGIAPEANGNLLVTSPTGLREITPSGVVTTYAGAPTSGGFADGPASNALFSRPQGLAIGQNGNVYVADFNNARIRTISTPH